MAFRAAAVARPPPPPPSPSSSSSSSTKPNPRALRRASSSSPPRSHASPAALSLVALFATSASYSEAKALAFSKESIVDSLTKVESTIDQVEDVGSKVVDFTLNIFKVLSDTLKPGVDAALPVLKSAGEEALKIALPVVSDASKLAKEALQSAGVDPSPVLSAAKTVADAAKQSTKVIEGAKPIASATVETIASSDPSVIVVSAGALFLAYLLLPPIWSAVSFNLRGYKGDLSPAQSLDLICSQNYLMIDIRSEKDKSKAGVPRLPSSAKSKMISVPLEELPSKIKGLVRNVKKVEAEIVAVKISYLKRVNKGSNIVLMDSYSDTAKTVARALTGLGFKNCWVMKGGFSGGNGWLRSGLGTDSYNLSLVEVLSPSRVIPAAAARFGTTSSTAFQSNRKLLPGSAD
ncbi:calcium sensing receptor, chloroplastic [Ananas comosus]|uniref:Calcium sensing receptor, chloroplastic n=1 Tax=Ananas comosus TaxID=4615 RepID=A0A6P5F2C0_ANACO|nr:calcium sensing receptor, chloroplastic [Ananas comosus]